MNQQSFEAWLLARSGDQAARLLLAAKELQSSVNRMSRHVGQLRMDAEHRRRVEELLLEEARLDGEIGLAAGKAEEDTAELLRDTGALLKRFELFSAVHALPEVQLLFDKLAPGDLRSPIAEATLPILSVDLRQSTLAEQLHEEVEEKIRDCAGKLPCQGGSGLERDAAEKEQAELRGRIKDCERRLAQHAVPSEVIAALRGLDEMDWYIEEILVPYHTAATVENHWNLPRDILRELTA